MQASHHSEINRAGLSLIVPTSSRRGRMARLCLWSGTVVDSERACGGACRCNASVACAAAAGWKLFADSNKTQVGRADGNCGRAPPSLCVSLRAPLTSSHSNANARWLSQDSLGALWRAPTNCWVTPPPPGSLVRKENCSSQSGSVTYHFQGFKSCVYNICSASHGV